MMQFERPDILYLLFLIPVFVIWFIFNRSKQKKKIETFGDADLLQTLSPNSSKLRGNWKFILLMLSFFFFIIGLANPQIGTKLEKVKRKGIEMMIALDVSNSMLAEDIKPNRLERAKRVVSQLIDKLHGDKIGLIVFAGKAYVQMPITVDYHAAKMFLQSINIGIVPVQGTAISEAISLGMQSFSEKNEKSKILLLITDGENHEEEAIELTKKAKEQNIRIYTIGMGLPKGTPIPIYDRYGRKDYKRDKEGNIVVTKLNEESLQKIAEASDGEYISANNLDQLVEKINKMDKVTFEDKIYSDYESQFQYFFAIALFFLILEILLVSKKNKYFKNINLFKTNIKQ